jgi:hypothetical protein
METLPQTADIITSRACVVTGEVLTLQNIADEINREHGAVLKHLRAAGKHEQSALEHGCKVGALLLQAKDKLSHGKWLPWLRANTQVSVRQAQRYLQLAQANASRVTHFTSQRAALAELSAPARQPLPEPKALSGAVLGDPREACAKARVQYWKALSYIGTIKQIADLPSPAEVVAQITSASAEIDAAALDAAVSWLTEFARLWKERNA